MNNDDEVKSATTDTGILREEKRALRSNREIVRYMSVKTAVRAGQTPTPIPRPRAQVRSRPDSGFFRESVGA